MNWLGIKNGQLLYQMQLNEFDILITNDKNMYYQQKIAGYNLVLLNINTASNRYEDVMNVFNVINNKLIELTEIRKISRASMYVVV